MDIIVCIATKLQASELQANIIKYYCTIEVKAQDLLLN